MSTYSNPEGRIGYNELSPYVQRLLKSGIGSGSSGNISIERSYQKINETMSNVKVNLNTFNKDTDALLVFKNGLFMTLDLEYTLNSDKTISPINEIWNGSEEKPILFDFISLGNALNNSITDINYIKINITMSEWVQEDDVYYKIVTHNLNSESLIFAAINSDTKRSLQEAYTLIDKNNIKLYSDNKINLSLTIIDVISSGSSSDNDNKNNKYISNISASNFEYDSNLDMYKTTITHNLGGDDLLIGIIDNNKKSVYAAYDIIDLNTIILYNTDQIDLNISILSI